MVVYEQEATVTTRKPAQRIAANDRLLGLGH